MKAHPFIEAEKAAGHGVVRACRLLEVSRAAYYQRRSGAQTPRRPAEDASTPRTRRLAGARHAGVRCRDRTIRCQPSASSRTLVDNAVR